MSQYQAEIAWQRAAAESFIDKRYSRAHEWRFDCGITVPASSSPHSVPVPYSKPENVDPEEAYVAAIASCHMLTFLWKAANAGYVVDSYYDSAIGYMNKNRRDRLAVTNVTLRPQISFSSSKPISEPDVERLHHEAHEECYIANSVETTIDIQGSWSVGDDERSHEPESRSQERERER
jgi:organic hydroperoxide reductase OsmC/OhrA